MATNSKKVKRKPVPPSKASKDKNSSTSKNTANDKKNKNTTLFSRQWTKY